MDFYGGQRDLKQKKIRILYSLSFVEDPARIIRAVRFERRYKFTIEKSTEKLLMKAIKDGVISLIRKKRLSEEFLIILQEKDPIGILKRMDELNILSNIIPNLSLSDSLINTFIEIEKFREYWLKTVSYTHLDVYKRQAAFLAQRRRELPPGQCRIRRWPGLRRCSGSK